MRINEKSNVHTPSIRWEPDCLETQNRVFGFLHDDDSDHPSYHIFLLKPNPHFHAGFEDKIGKFFLNTRKMMLNDPNNYELEFNDLESAKSHAEQLELSKN